MAVTPSPTMRAMVCVQGAQARTAGLPITGNPYADTKLQRAWDDGWTHAVQPQLTGPTYTRLRAALDAWIVETGDRGAVPEPPEVVAPFEKEMHDWFGTPAWAKTPTSR